MAATNGANGAEPTRIAPARPTIKVDGEENAALALGLISLCISESTTGLYRCEALLGNWGEQSRGLDFLYFDRKVIDFGKRLEIALAGTTVFDGRIMAIEGHFRTKRPPQITILAEDRFQDLRMTRRTRTFTDRSDKQVMEQIASDHGLTLEITLPGPRHRTLAQINQSDLAFLRERARAVDAELWIENTTLHVEQRSHRLGRPLALRWGNQLREFSVIADLARQCTSASVFGWDVSGKQALAVEATASVLGSELNGEQSGPHILEQAYGVRKEMIAHTLPWTREEAQVEADAYLRMAARRFVVGRGVAEPDARLRVGATVEMEGLGPLFSGRYYIAESHLYFDGVEGVRVEFAAERPGLGAP